MRCWLCQSLFARRLDDGAELPAWIRRHLEQCRPCQARYQVERRLIAQLTASAPDARAEAPPFLRTRILAHVSAASATPAASVRGWTWGRAWTVSGAALAVALMLVLVRWGSAPGGSDSPAHAEAGTRLQAALVELPSPETVLAMSMQLDAPLQGEWDRVMGDARTALAALSRRFLPSHLDATAP